MKEYTDTELLEMFQKDETSAYAFNLLVSKYQKTIYWNVRRMVMNHEDADDITQNIFIKIWRHLKNFRHEAQLSTWIYRISVNETITFINKQKLKALVRFTDYNYFLENQLTSENGFSGSAIEKTLQKALLKLPPKQKMIFNLRYYDALPYEKISEITGTSVGALKASYHIAVKKIEKFVSEN